MAPCVLSDSQMRLLPAIRMESSPLLSRETSVPSLVLASPHSPEVHSGETMTVTTIGNSNNDEYSRYIDTMGAGVFVDHMRRFEQSYGVAFKPCQLLVDMAKSGKKFYN